MKRLAVVALGLSALNCLGQASMEVSGSGAALTFGGNPVGYQGFGSNNTPVNPANLNSGWLMMFRFTLNPGRWLAHEAGMGYGHNSLHMDFNNILQLDQSRTTWLWFYDLLVCATPEDAAFRPCAAVGPHMLNYAPRETLALIPKDTDRKIGFNFGGVAKFRVGYHFLVRVDFREYVNPKPFALVGQHGWLQQREFSAGFGLRF
jgi:hypothetical protein